MEILGIILLIVMDLVLTYAFKSITEDWGAAFFISLFVIMSIMLGTGLTMDNKSRKDGVKEYLQHPERYTIKYVYEDSIPVDTIVELK